uniref:ribonuclease H n=1 Tax=Cyprinus carpio carpio TaxID=630221 RepID=A0A9J8AHZ8_CYPCA
MPYLSCSQTHTQCEVLFSLSDISECLSLSAFPCITLNCSDPDDSLPPALLTLCSVHDLSTVCRLPPAVSSNPAATPNTTVSTHASHGIRLSLPEKYDCSPSKCKGFLMQCYICINQQPLTYSMDESRVAFVCSLLTGKALEWATVMWQGNHMSFPTYDRFICQFREVFEHSASGKDAGEELIVLRQGRSTTAEYTLAFCTLAAQTGWKDKPLRLFYRKGLNHDLQSELACREEGRTLDQFMDLAIRLDNLIRSRRTGRHSPDRPVAQELPAPEPLQIGATQLPSMERERCIRQHLCLYCGQAGHLRVSCPIRPSHQNSTAVSTHLHSFGVPVVINIEGRRVDTDAMIDSGAAGNFNDISFAETHDIPLLSCESRVAVAALDGHPLGSGKIEYITQDINLQIGALHTETIRLFAIDSPRNPIILGLPWLERHNPRISWSTQEIVHWSQSCQDHCLLTRLPSTHPQEEERNPSDMSGPPIEYQDLVEAFSKTKASRLPLHRPVDCAIDLIPGSTPPKGRIFPLSQPESAAMREYIEEELAKGFITPSKSPASAGFFFKKKDGGLRPCIDYRALNEISVKFRYLLPLVPSALEQLCNARYFTKLDLRSAYNLIRIHKGDEWKTAFSTTSGHYEYRVMPFGLANSPSVFQALINDVFRDMLNQCVIIYIDILIYSESMEAHVKQVRAVLQRLIQHQLYAKLQQCEFHKFPSWGTLSVQRMRRR